MGKFGELVTVAEWKKALEDLLDRAAALSGEGKEIGEVLDDLQAFIKASPAKCDFLDKIAFKAGGDLADAEINRRIASIAARKQDIEAAMKTLTSATDDLQKAKSNLEFEQIVKTLKLSTAIVDELSELRAALSESEKSALDKAIAAAKTASDIQKLLKEHKAPVDA
jgi:hypothetical protein